MTALVTLSYIFRNQGLGCDALCPTQARAPAQSAKRKRKRAAGGRRASGSLNEIIIIIIIIIIRNDFKRLSPVKDPATGTF